jgi:hypothetical protein
LLSTRWLGERFSDDRLRAGSRTIRCDEDLHRARVPESLESGGSVVDARYVGSQIRESEPSIVQ